MVGLTIGRWPRRGVRTAALAAVAAFGLLTPATGATAAPTPSATTQPASSTTPGTAPASTASKATFGIGPADAKGLDGRPYLNFLVQPGSVVTDHAEVINLATTPITLNVYVASATVGSDGRFGYLARAAKQTDVATWMTIGAPVVGSKLTLAARSRAIIPISLAIPRDADPGDYAAGIITSVTSKVTSNSGTNANLEQRVALRSFVRVGGALRPSLAVDNLTASYDGSANPVGGGTATVRYTVRNNGNVRLGAHQQVVVSGLFGDDKPTKALADVPLLLPRTSITMSVTIPDVLPQVHLSAKVTLYPLAVAGDVDPGAPKSVSASTGFWAVPWALIIIVVVLLAAGVAFWMWRRRRAQRPPAPPSGRHRPGGGLDKDPAGPAGPTGSDSSDPVTTPDNEGVPA